MMHDIEIIGKYEFSHMIGIHVVETTADLAFFILVPAVGARRSTPPPCPSASSRPRRAASKIAIRPLSPGGVVSHTKPRGSFTRMWRISSDLAERGAGVPLPMHAQGSGQGVVGDRP